MAQEEIETRAKLFDAKKRLVGEKNKETRAQIKEEIDKHTRLIQAIKKDMKEHENLRNDLTYVLDVKTNKPCKSLQPCKRENCKGCGDPCIVCNTPNKIEEDAKYHTCGELCFTSIACKGDMYCPSCKRFANITDLVEYNIKTNIMLSFIKKHKLCPEVLDLIYDIERNISFCNPSI